jgi:protein phosphatase
MATSMDLELDFHLVSDRGLTRATNEDRCGAFTPEDAAIRAERGRLFLVADGMGGYAGGDDAAELTVAAVVARYFFGEWHGPGTTLRLAFEAAAEAIAEHARTEPRRRSMGAAAVGAAIVGESATLVHVGDCRSYVLRDARLQPLTVDHSWVQGEISIGRLTPDAARSHPQRGMLTQALGLDYWSDPDVTGMTLQPGDGLLLCSDGVWELLSDGEMLRAMLDTPDARSAALQLVDGALEHGGSDNATAVVIRVRGSE